MEYSSQRPRRIALRAVLKDVSPIVARLVSYSSGTETISATTGLKCSKTARSSNRLGLWRCFPRHRAAYVPDTSTVR